MTTVNEPAAEREPDHVTPCWLCNSTGNLNRIGADGELEVVGCTACAAMVLTTRATPDSPYTTREGTATITVSGLGVHNPSFNHRVMAWVDGSVTLLAQPTVIALRSTGDELPHAGAVLIGDTVLVDGQPYVVTARPLGDPVLVPVSPAVEGQPDPTCWACQGAGTTGDLDTDVFECTVCDGTGLSAQHRAELPDTDIRSALATDLERMGLMPDPWTARAELACSGTGVHDAHGWTSATSGSVHCPGLTAEQWTANRASITPERRAPLAWPYEVPPPSGFDPEPACPHGYDAEDACEGCTPPAPAEPDEQPMDWYFTFGHGQTHRTTGEDLLGAYVVIHGTATAAREQMVAAFGTAWCDQYSSAEGAGVERFALRRIELPTVEPEQRTVSLEALTDELRFVYSAEPIPAEARVAIVLRENGAPVLVADTDVPWTQTDLSPVKALRGLLTEMISSKNRLEREQPVRSVELLMPTPDVLAALDGRPDAGFWSAPVPVTARHIEEGWLVVSYSGPGTEERIEAKRDDCGAADCPWPGDCTQLTIGDDKPQHFADWTTLTVRIPAAVTR